MKNKAISKEQRFILFSKNVNVSLFVLFIFLFFGCATIIAPRKQSVKVDSNPQGATVYVDDSVMGKTPITVKVKTRARQNIFCIENDSLGKRYYVLKRQIGMGYFLADFTFIPFMIVDVSTRMWNIVSTNLILIDFYNDSNFGSPNDHPNLGGEQVSGTGFLIDTAGYIVTNVHVVENAKKIEIVFNDGEREKKYSATIQNKDVEHDLAILLISDNEFHVQSSLPFVIDSTNRVGQDIFTIGYPLGNIMGNNFKLTTGIINSLTGYQDNESFLQISAQVQPGNSGGPLFDSKGNIIGVTSATLYASNNLVQNVNYAVKTKYLLNLIRNNDSIHLNTTNSISTLELPDKVDTLRNYVCKINVIKK